MRKLAAWELVSLDGIMESLDEKHVFARFLPEKGSSVHHIAVATPSKVS